MTVTIDGTSVTVEQRIIESRTVNDEIPSKQIKVVGSTLGEAYDTDLLVSIDINGTTEYYLTGHDDFARTSRNPVRYTHTITLIGLEKELEKVTLPSLQYTQALDTTTYTKLDIIDRALKLITLDTRSNLASNRVYDIQGIGTRDSNNDYVVGNLSGLALKLYNQKAFEYKANTPTLKELCDDVLQTLDGRTVIKTISSGLRIIDIDYYNDRSEEIVLSDCDEITGKQSIEKNAQKFDVYMENAISESNTNKQAIVYPSAGGWASVRSLETEITDTNFYMPVPENIERILKFEILADVEINYGETNGTTSNDMTFSGVLEADATELLFTKRAWNGLDYTFTSSDNDGSTDTWFNVDVNKIGSLYWENNSINGFHEKVDIFALFSNVKGWHTFLSRLAYQNGDLTVTSGYWVDQVYLTGIPGSSERPQFNTSFRDFMYRVTYVPKATSRIRLEKTKSTGKGTLYANQTARIVDVEQLGINLKSKLNRDGNKTLTLTKTVESYDDVFTLESYYGDYNASKVINDITYNSSGIHHIKSIVELGKNFAVRSERVNIENKPRQTQISAENTIRNDIIEQYIMADFSTSTNTSFLQSEGLGRFKETLNNSTATYDNPIEFALVVTRDTSGTALNYELKEYLIPCISQGVADVLHFKFQFEDNIIAGKQLDQLDTIYGNRNVTYVDDNGQFASVEFDLCDTFTSTTNTFASKATNAKSLPLKTTDMAVANRLIESDVLWALKDSGEEYALTYQLMIYSNDDDLLIGYGFAQNNALVLKDAPTIYIYESDTKFTDVSKIPTDATQKELVLGTPTASQVKYSITSGSDYVTFQLQTNKPTDKYWAIGDNDRNLYFAVNTELATDTVYFTPRKER